MAIWSAGSAFGIAAGFAGGGLLAARFGWRLPFFASAAPGLLFAVLAFLTTLALGSIQSDMARMDRLWTDRSWA